MCQVKKKVQSEQEEEDKEEVNDKHSISYEMVTEDEKEKPKKRAEKATSSPMTKSTDPKSVVLNVAFDNEKDCNYIYKLCNNQIIFQKFRTWMNR